MSLSACMMSSSACMMSLSAFNSFAGKANYYGIHVVQNKCCMLQENVVSKQLTPYDQETTDQYVVDCKVLNRLDKQSGFSIVPAVQYWSVAHERVNV